jgi:hypothetical protein
MATHLRSTPRRNHLILSKLWCAGIEGRKDMVLTNVPSPVTSSKSNKIVRPFARPRIKSRKTQSPSPLAKWSTRSRRRVSPTSEPSKARQCTTTSSARLGSLPPTLQGPILNQPLAFRRQPSMSPLRRRPIQQAQRRALLPAAMLFWHRQLSKWARSCRICSRHFKGDLSVAGSSHFLSIGPAQTISLLILELSISASFSPHFQSSYGRLPQRRLWTRSRYFSAYL